MKRRAHLAGLLALPMFWLIGIYIFSLAMLLVTAFWTTDPFTSKVKPGFTLRNFEQLVTNPAYLSTAVRTLVIALAVTVLCMLISVPLGIFMAKIAKPWLRALLAVAITLPLWAGYLVKILAMRVTFTEEGFFNWAMAPLGITGPGFSVTTVVLTLTYLWLPYMAVPVYTAIRQLPNNL